MRYVVASVVSYRKTEIAINFKSLEVSELTSFDLPVYLFDTVKLGIF